MKTFRQNRSKVIFFAVLTSLMFGATVLTAAPVNSQAKANHVDPMTLKASDWASWPEVSIPTVAEVQSTCFEVERQCRRSGTAASLCAKEKRSCLAPTTL